MQTNTKSISNVYRIPKYTVFINQTQKKYLDGAFFALKFWSVRPQESHYICK